MTLPCCEIGGRSLIDSCEIEWEREESPMLKVLVMLTFGSAALLLSACTEQQPGMKAWIEGNVPQESYQVAKKHRA